MTQERELKPMNGWFMLLIYLCLWAWFGWTVLQLAKTPGQSEGRPDLIVQLGASILLGVLTLPGFFILNPNTSKVMVLFGRYAGTARRDGFWWSNPFFVKTPVSLRAQTLNGERLKVNDQIGNPVEIAAIIIWQIEDTYKACFEVENVVQFVALQSETALRHSASSYPYDADEGQVSLMRNTDELAEHLLAELQERLKRAGIRVLEARLSHLAYAQEIAGVMLRKQQAAAIIAARQRIVDGAVGMVEMALDHLATKKIVDLDPERKATMVSNLMVVLCSESAVQPVLNAGTLAP
ncbi:MAG: SPFH domain-containing protein [Armatimonadetes bacterium]|nr:SPFH domain-containing protein [Armatimonadota bacterium]